MGGGIGFVNVPDFQVIRFQGVRMLWVYEMIAFSDNLPVVTFLEQTENKAAGRAGTLPSLQLFQQGFNRS